LEPLSVVEGGEERYRECCEKTRRDFGGARSGETRYRVRARNARIAAMRWITLTRTYKIKAVELRTIVIII
jgi:hypothetical protein